MVHYPSGDESPYDGNYYSSTVDGHTKIWKAETLWKYAEGFSPKLILVPDLLEEYFPDLWMCLETEPERVKVSDLSYPIILNCNGRIMDGYHRVSKAYLLGHIVILAVQFTREPPPDKELDHDRKHEDPLGGTHMEPLAGLPQGQ